MSRHRVEVTVPSWLDDLLDDLPTPADGVARMGLAVDLARRNVEEGTGGPFGAVVAEAASGRVLAVGVNLVVAAGTSMAHAEMVAIGLAERVIGGFDLSAGGRNAELASTVEPCAMCLGAVVWSGVRSLVCGAPSSAATAIGFDEGPRPAEWVEALETRGVSVHRGVLAEPAAAVLTDYAARGGPLYNAAR